MTRVDKAQEGRWRREEGEREGGREERETGRMKRQSNSDSHVSINSE